MRSHPSFVRKALRTVVGAISQKEWLFPWTIILCLISLTVGGCGAILSGKQEEPLSLGQSRISAITRADLAGIWEYQEGTIIYALPLDEHGDGTYEWKNGQFHTTSLSDGVWKGTWTQEENDREGGFELHLSDDIQSAKGRWWYTRIGKDHEPLDPGGSFTVRRKKGL